MPTQVARLQKCLAAIVTHVPREKTLLRIRGIVQEGFRFLRVVAHGTRIPVATLLQMGVKKALKGVEALATVLASIRSELCEIL